MDLDHLQANWNTFGRVDPLWAILTDPTKKGNRWEVEAFFRTGERESEDIVTDARALGRPRRFVTALDFGCGIGRVTQALADHFDRCVGVDISPSMIARANQHNRHATSRCRYQVNATDDLALFADAEFDLIYASRVLQHIEPRYTRNYLAEFIRVLRPGGLVIVDLPSESGFFPNVQDAPDAMPAAAFRAELSVVGDVRRMDPATPISLTVQVTNASDRRWALSDTCPIRLGNHWLDAEGHMLVLDDQRVSLPSPLEPKGRVALPLSVTAPASPGEYILRLDVVQESVAWFQDVGSSPLDLSITVSRSQVASRTGVPLSSPKAPAPPPPHADAVMEMHAVGREEVLALLKQSGATVLEYREVYHCGPTWRTYKYFSTKEADGTGGAVHE